MAVILNAAANYSVGSDNARHMRPSRPCIQVQRAHSSRRPINIYDRWNFFTFLGIAEGLYEFNPQKIDASIPALLDGLKTAFIASVVGVGAALSLKLRYAVLGVKQSNPSARPEGATVDDLYAQLAGIQQSLVGTDELDLAFTAKVKPARHQRSFGRALSITNGLHAKAGRK